VSARVSPALTRVSPRRCAAMTAPVPSRRPMRSCTESASGLSQRFCTAYATRTVSPRFAESTVASDETVSCGTRTRTVATPITPSTSARTCVAPRARVVTFPVALVRAMVVSAADHTIVRPARALPALSRGIAAY
jgi:hypothetical protein